MWQKSGSVRILLAGLNVHIRRKNLTTFRYLFWRTNIPCVKLSVRASLGLDTLVSNFLRLLLCVPNKFVRALDTTTGPTVTNGRFGLIDLSKNQHSRVGNGLTRGLGTNPASVGQSPVHLVLVDKIWLKNKMGGGGEGDSEWRKACWVLWLWTHFMGMTVGRPRFESLSTTCCPRKMA